MVTYNNNFLHDLRLGQLGEKLIGSILSEKKLEVKTDYGASSTGNLFVEYKSRGKYSGISTSDSDFYCFIISNEKIFIVEANKLKNMCRKYLNTSRDVTGGDNHTSRGILLPLKDLIECH